MMEHEVGQADYRRTFNDEGDRMVLADILNICLLYATDTPAQMGLTAEEILARQSVGKEILGRYGSWGPTKAFDITDALAGIPPRGGEE
jgi:hypothetical protein